MSISLTQRERRDNYNLLDVHNAKFEVSKLMPIFRTFLTDDRQRGVGVLVHTVLIVDCYIIVNNRRFGIIIVF